MASRLYRAVLPGVLLLLLAAGHSTLLSGMVGVDAADRTVMRDRWDGDGHD